MRGAIGLLDELHRRDRALALGGWLMLGGFAVAVFIAPFDTRLITGINPWIKPMKFLLSIGIFLWTMAWFMAEADPRQARRLAIIRWTMLIAMSVEIALITLQAARGTTSHFNVAAPFDALVFDVMGVLIVANTAAAAGFLATLRPVEPARAGYLWGLRLGLTIFALGSLQGFLMVANMAHTVPPPDGGPGLPFVNWSTTAGDLRIAHFIGLHALQLLPVAGVLLDRVWQTAPHVRARAVQLLAVAWLVTAATTTLMALAGRPLPAGL
jgi:hypothetical protein